MKLSSRFFRKGFTLIESSVVLSIVALVISAIWGAFSAVTESQRQTDALVELQMITQNVTSLMQGQNFAVLGLISANMINAGAVPSIYVNNAVNPPKINTPWGKNGLTIFAIGNNTFTVTLQNISLAGCLHLLPLATSCQVGQPACPNLVWGASNSNPNSLAPRPFVPGGIELGWANMTNANAQIVCAGLTGANAPNKIVNTVTLQYQTK